jgi:tetratricopeptide (TPR) repeat protein
MVSARLTAAVFALLLLAAGASAQSRPAGGRPGTPESGTGSIRGRVVMPGGENISQAVKIILRSLRGDHTLAYTDTHGAFEMRAVAPGEYTLEVEADTQRQFEEVSARVTVNRATPSLITIYLKEKREAARERGPGGPVVSATELGQKVPGPARKEFEQAAAAGRAGRTEEAVAHLRKALSIFPEYLMALNDLGTHLLALGRLDEAAEELRRAVRLDPKAFNPQLNLCIVLVEQQKFVEAAEELEKALALDARAPSARLYAGRAYLALGMLERAEKELNAAYEFGGGHYALALFHLGHLYMDKGERDLALRAFETYLREAPDATNAEHVKRMIGILR